MLLRRSSLLWLSATSCLVAFGLAGCPSPGPGPVPTPIPIPITGNGAFSVGVNPTSALPGASILYGVSNASASEDGDILWEGMRVATFSVGADGSASGHFRVPDRATAASHSLTIEVGSTQADATFGVDLAASVSPGSGRPGTVLDIRATNAVPGQSYTAYWEGRAIGTKNAGADEGVDFSFTVPTAVTSGDHAVRIVGDGTEADLSYRVPDLSITAPGRVRWNDTFAVATSGEIPGHTYQLFWDGNLEGSAVADSSGASTFTMRVPDSSNVGNHTLKVADEAGTGLSGAVTIRIPDEASFAGPSSLDEGETGWYSGSGFAPDEVVTVSDGWQDIASVTTDMNGNFTLSIRFDTSGYHDVSAQGTRGDQDSVDVNVAAPYVPTPPPVYPGNGGYVPTPPPVYPGNGGYVPTPPPVDPGNGGYVPTPPPVDPGNGGAPSGATAICNDGTYSFSQTHSGTCSYHGGVATWLN